MYVCGLREHPRRHGAHTNSAQAPHWSQTHALLVAPPLKKAIDFIILVLKSSIYIYNFL